MNFDFYLFMKVGGIAVFIFAGGAAAAKQLALKRSQTYIVNAIAAFIGMVGSRSWYVIQNDIPRMRYEGIGLLDAWNDSGSVLYGWILGGTAALYFLTRWKKWPFLRYMDAVLPWLLVAQFMNRMGCFDAGCCYGKLTDFPVAIHSWVLAGQVHPVQLYEAFFDLALFAFIKTRPRRIGLPTFLYFTGYPIARFFFESLRGDNGPALWFMTVPQVTSVLILFCVAILKNRIMPPTAGR